MVLSRYAFSTEKWRRTRSRPIPGSFRLQTSTLQGNCRQGRARARRVLTDEKTIGTLWSHAHVSMSVITVPKTRADSRPGSFRKCGPCRGVRRPGCVFFAASLVIEAFLHPARSLHTWVTRGAIECLPHTDNDIWAADIHLTPNGRFLYASERTTSTIGALRVDGASGKLVYVGSTPTEKQPRGFNIDPTGQFIVVSGEKSDMLAVYSIQAESGALKSIGRYPTGKGANWVDIVA